MDKIMDIMNNLGNLEKFIPKLDDIMGLVHKLISLAVRIGPVCILILGLIYLLIPPKEANRYFGYRTYFGMGSILAWRFTQRVSGAGGDDEQIQQLFGADGFGSLDAINDPAVADALHLPHQVVGFPESGVGGSGVFGDDGDDVAPAGADLFQGLYGPAVGAEGAADGKADGFFLQNDPSFQKLSSSRA